jgi:NodT family efflux transporter outer membrane factor (OMF) lipoprotein
MWEESKMRSVISTLAALAPLIFLTSCAVGPNFVRPAPPKANGYLAGPTPKSTAMAEGQAQNFVIGKKLSADWWRLFRNPQLDGIMTQALAQNPTVLAAQASLRQSQASLRAGYGVFFPQAAANIGASNQQFNPASIGQSGSTSSFNLFTLSASVSYTLDIFGGERRTVEALAAQVDAQRANVLAAYLMLSSNLVNTAVAQAAYRAQIQATQELVALEDEQVRMTKVQADAGTVPYANVLSLQTQAENTRALIPPLQQKVDQADHLLATLAGRPPAEWQETGLKLEGFILPTDLPLSVPSELVRQRPDILLAEAQLHVSNANIGVATAAMLPRLSLSASYGVESNSVGSLFNPASALWNLAGNIAGPLFQGGTLYYQRKAAIAAHDQSLELYRQTVLSAFAQVADSLRGLVHDAESVRAESSALKAARESMRLMQDNYQAGIANYLQVLTAQDQYLQAKIGYIQAIAQRYQDTVALYVALGGGWWNK